MTRYIFVTGGVVSSIGKGLTSASLGYLLKSRGFKVKIRKLSPEDHQVFKQSALCTLCEGEHAETKSFHKHKIGEIYNDNRTIN